MFCRCNISRTSLSSFTILRGQILGLQWAGASLPHLICYIRETSNKWKMGKLVFSLWIPILLRQDINSQMDFIFSADEKALLNTRIVSDILGLHITYFRTTFLLHIFLQVLKWKISFNSPFKLSMCQEQQRMKITVSLLAVSSVPGAT
jgi:hypothetical protein